MDVETTRDGLRFLANWHVEGGLLIVTSPYGSRTAKAAATARANEALAQALLGHIVDDAVGPGRRR